MVKTSLIKKITKDSVDKIILFNKFLKDEELPLLKEEFGLNSNSVKRITSSYRNIGLILTLNQQQACLNFDWSPFINKVIIKNDIINKLDNVFINSDCNRILILTTKRLLKMDIDKLNEKIERVNQAICRYNVKIDKERKEIENDLKKLA
ncbi:MAG: hypothetical protein ABIC04_04375 [Nanoarchaeota archaeon]